MERQAWTGELNKQESMPKAEAGTPKALANRMKAKGLQKLKWYCQMCQKQCRDENGFKCHTMSEGHLRQMRVYSENPAHVMEEFSQEFEDSFLEVLSRLHGTKRVRANQVYQELIADKQHIHMNATKWDTLTTFVKYMGKKGYCVVDETEKGWYIQYIDRSYLKQKEELDKLKKADLDEEARQQRILAARAEAARAHLKATGGDRGLGAPGGSELQRDDSDGKIVVSLAEKAAEKASQQLKRPRPKGFGADDDDDDDASNAKRPVHAAGGGGQAKPKSELERLMELDASNKKAEAEEKRRQVQNSMAEERTDHWLTPGIIVKILNKKVGAGKYYKKKGRVERVIEKYRGEVKLVETGERLRLDQDDLETVIPAVDGTVLVLNGPGKGMTARLLQLDIDKYAAKITVLEGGRRGDVLEGVPYEDICKVDVDFVEQHRR